MARHKITCSDKDKDGDITGIGNSSGHWSKQDAIKLIEAGSDSFYVQQSGTNAVDIQVINGQTGKYLRTTSDSSDKNNLDNLQLC